MGQTMIFKATSTAPGFPHRVFATSLLLSMERPKSAILIWKVLVSRMFSGCKGVGWVKQDGSGSGRVKNDGLKSEWLS